ncbi:hypothetical protein K492DRAFT_173371 [Lichtheimia hyalospora FSU 10163]|nr:hypothetical protein K492DRAFT_173371 [Lichtheimia hyalospora FSU 10163]
MPNNTSPRRASFLVTESSLPRRSSSIRNSNTKATADTTSRRRSSITAMTASSRAKLKQQQNDTTDKRNSLVKKTSPRNHAEPNSAKNRRLLAELVSENDNQSTIQEDGTMWKELLHIKERLEKLEVKSDDDADDRLSSTTSSSTATTLRTPTSVPAQQQPMQTPQRTTVHQRRLEEAYRQFEQQQPPMSPLVRTMANVVFETINMNQRLWASIPKDLDARSLVALQKSSDHQLRELTIALQHMSTPLAPPSPPTTATTTPPSYYTHHHHQPLHYHQHNSHLPRYASSYHGGMSPAIRPTKVAGILDYDYLASPPSSSSMTTRSSPRYQLESRHSHLLYGGQ